MMGLESTCQNFKNALSTPYGIHLSKVCPPSDNDPLLELETQSHPNSESPRCTPGGALRGLVALGRLFGFLAGSLDDGALEFHGCVFCVAFGTKPLEGAC